MTVFLQVLICGDQRGNLTVYPLSKGLIVDNSDKIVEEVSLLRQFKGAHGISSVNSILLSKLNPYQTEVHTVMTV